MTIRRTITTPQNQPPPLAPKPHKVRRALLVGAAGTAVLLIGFGIGNTAHPSTIVNPTVTVTKTAPPVTVTAKATVTVTAPAPPAVTVTAAAPPASTVTAQAAPAATVTAPAAPPAGGSYSASDPGAFSDCMADAMALSNAGDYEGAMRKNGECARLIG